MIVDELRIALDPAVFAEEALGFTLDPWQSQVLRSVERRIVLNCGRQTGKSLLAIILALHRAIFYPGSLSLLVSPSLRQSSALIRRLINLLERLEVKPQLIEMNKLSVSLENRSIVLALPSREGNIRGFTANLVVEDEASRISDDTHLALRPMVSVSGGRFIMMSTPAGMRGHFYETWVEGKGWEKVQVTAFDCPRISRDFLEEERIALGERLFGQEYGCQFVEMESQLFGYDLIAQAITSEITPLFGGVK
jgi:hypothetical protein